MRSVVAPFVRSTYANRARRLGCSSPNGGAPSVPKKSASSTARGDHFPITGGGVEGEVIPVLRVSAPWESLLGAGWGEAPPSGLLPCAKTPGPQNPRFRE